MIVEIGREKAIELYIQTCNVENSGGMMTADRSRRRTPGGVYIQLLKSDPDIPLAIKVSLSFANGAKMW